MEINRRENGISNKKLTTQRLNKHTWVQLFSFHHYHSLLLMHWLKWCKLVVLQGCCLCADSHTMAKAQIDVLHMCMTGELHAPCSAGLFTGCSLFKAQWLEVSGQRHVRLTSRSFSFSSASVSFTLLTNICRISSSLRCRSPRNSFLLASYVSWRLRRRSDRE